MKLFLTVLCLIGQTAFLSAAHTFKVPEVGVTIRTPDEWKQDAKDSFGVIIRPSNDNRKKIRIHLTANKDISLELAVQRSAEKIRESNKHESVLSSTALETASGMKGQKVIVGTAGVDGPPYLNRYYFKKPDGRIFCVCVYHYGDAKFSKAAEEAIIQSLMLL